MKNIFDRKIQILGFAAVLMFCSCGLLKFEKSYNHDYIKIIDSRDGKIYKTIQIGEQTWMAENLNFETDEGSWCYDNDSINCEKYGKLYNWETAVSACPDGWRLPSKIDFTSLLTNVYNIDNQYYQSLIDGGSSGFNAQFCGWRDNDGNFSSIEGYGPWWTSLEYDDASYASCLIMYNSPQETDLKISPKEHSFTVRCIKNH